jgi:hypothetical protein
LASAAGFDRRYLVCFFSGFGVRAARHPQLFWLFQQRHRLSLSYPQQVGFGSSLGIGFSLLHLQQVWLAVASASAFLFASATRLAQQLQSTFRFSIRGKFGFATGSAFAFASAAGFALSVASSLSLLHPQQGLAFQRLRPFFGICGWFGWQPSSAFSFGITSLFSAAASLALGSAASLKLAASIL